MRPAYLLPLCIALLAGFAVYYSMGDDDSIEGLDRDRGAVATPEDSGASLAEAEGHGDSTESGGQRNPVVPEGEAARPGASGAPDYAGVDANRLSGVVVDDAGDPIPDCTVIFLAGGSGAFSWNQTGELELSKEPVRTTDEGGAYEFENLPPGEDHALVVQNPEILIKIVEGVIVGDFGSFEEPPIVLRYGKRIRGKVENQFGLPVAGARLHLDARWKPSNPQASVDRLSATTDANGDYQIRGIADGTRCLTVEAEGFGTLTRIQSLVFADKTGQAHIVNFTLTNRSKLSGRVTTLDGGPIAGAEVIAVDRTAYRNVSHGRATSAEDGSFSIVDVTEGTFELRVSAPGYGVSVKKDVQVPIEGLNLLLTKSPHVRGQVVDAETGEPIRSFSLRFRQQENAESPNYPRGQFQAISASAEGEFSIPALPPAGGWLLEARSAGYAATYSDLFETSDGADFEGVIVGMVRGGAILGRLVDASGDPVFGGRVISRDDSWSDDAFSAALGDQEGSSATVREVRSDKEGSFVIENLKPAKYQVIARSSGLHQVQRRGLDIEEGAAIDVGDIVLQEGAHMRGVLYDSESSPITGGMVFLKPQNQEGGVPVRRSKTGALGEWRMRNVVSGTYLLSADPPGADRGSFSLWPSRNGEEVVLQGGAEHSRDIHLDDWTKPKPPEPLPPTGYVGGTLLGPDGVGLVGAGIELAPADLGFSAPHMAKSEREGKFSFIRIPPGDYILFATGHAEPRMPVTVVADQWTHQDLRLTQ